MNKLILVSTRERSLAKGLTWETSGLMTGLFVAWFFTGSPTTALQISLTFFPIRLTMYFLHERMWKHIRWGHKEVPDDD